MSGLPIDQEDIPQRFEIIFGDNDPDKLLPATRWARMVRHSDLSPPQRLVALTLYTYCQGKGLAECWVAQETLAWNTGLAKKTVNAAIRELERLEWVSRESLSKREAHAIVLCYPNNFGGIKRVERGRRVTSRRGTTDTTRVTWHVVSGEPLSPSGVDDGPSGVDDGPSGEPPTPKGFSRFYEGENKASDSSSDGSPVPPGCKPCFYPDGELGGWITPSGETVYLDDEVA